MRYEFTPEEEDFRAELVDWIDELDDDYKSVSEGGSDEDWAKALEVRHMLAEKGWLTLHWPVEYGGQGASMMKQVIFTEEMVYHSVPGRDGFGTRMLAPTLILSEKRHNWPNRKLAWRTGGLKLCPWAFGAGWPQSGSGEAPP